MASGSHCSIGLNLFIGRGDGSAALVGVDDLWYHTGQSWIYVSTFLRFYIFPSGGSSEGSGGLSKGSGGLQGGTEKWRNVDPQSPCVVP